MHATKLEFGEKIANVLHHLGLGEKALGRFELWVLLPVLLQMCMSHARKIGHSGQYVIERINSNRNELSVAVKNLNKFMFQDKNKMKG